MSEKRDILLFIFRFVLLKKAKPISLVAPSVKNMPAMQETTCSTGDPGSSPRSGRSPGGGNGNPLQYSYLENAMDRGAWWAIVHGIARVGHDLATKPPPEN